MQRSKQRIFNNLKSLSDVELLEVDDQFKNSTDDCKKPKQEVGLDRDNEAGSTILMPGQTLKGTGFKIPEPKDYLSYYSSPNLRISLTREDLTRYKMAWRTLQFYEQIGVYTLDRSSTARWSWDIPTAFFQRCKDWPNIGDLSELPIALGFTSAAIVYGGLHALAWSAHFESSTQQLLWRISACVVMGGFPVCCVLLESSHYFELYITNDFRLDDIFELTLVVSSALVALAYMLARAYLVIECFISLSHLPAGVYDVPRWASYFPHIS